MPKVTGGGAEFSPDRRYRYALWRAWGPSLRRVFFICLNPSIADETTDDPTQRRLRRFAYDWGYDGYIMGNLFAYISTDPKPLRKVADPIGPENDAYLKMMHETNDLTVVAWGRGGNLMGRGKEVLGRLQGKTVKCFGLNSDGSPKHPLYLAANTSLQPI